MLLASDEAFKARRPLLQRLALALESDDGHVWSRVDVLPMFDESFIAVEHEHERERRLARVENWRNAFVLLPLFITWIGIALAVGAHHRLASSDDPDDIELVAQPFIQLWSDGFDGRTPATLERIAILDGVVVMGAAALTLQVGRLRRSLEPEARLQRQAKWTDLHEALVDASLVLASRAYDTPYRFNEALGRLMEHYTTLSSGMERASSGLQEVLEANRSALDAIGTASGKLAELGGAALDPLDRLAESSDGIRSHLSEWAGSAARTQESVAGIATEHTAMTEKVAASVTEISGTTSELGTALARLGPAVDRVQQAFVEALGTEIATRAASAEGVTTAAAQLADLAGTLERSAEQHRVAASAVGTYATALPERLGSAESLIADGLAATQKAIHELPASIERGLAPIDPLVGEVHALRSDTLGVRDAVGGVTAELHDLARDIRGVADTVYGTLAHFEEAGRPIPQALGEAAGHLREASYAMAASAAAAGRVPRDEPTRRRRGPLRRLLAWRAG
jgi:hypothetical protein